MTTTILPTLYKALEEKYNQPRPGVHVSDLLYCQRESIFKRLQPKPVDNTQLGFFTSGKAIGEAIQTLVQSDPERWVAEQEVWLRADGTIHIVDNHQKGLASNEKYMEFYKLNPETDLMAHIDLYDRIDNIPVECKSANVSDMEQPKSHYTQQLRYYMALTNAERGLVLVQLLQHFRSKNGQKGQPFKEWVISLSPEELQREREKLLAEKASYEKALSEKNPAIAKHVMGTEESWKCTNCKWLAECQEIQKIDKMGVKE